MPPAPRMPTLIIGSHYPCFSAACICGQTGSMTILLAILIGLVGGVCGGLFGIGGGVIVVPALVFLMGYSQHKAQGTSLVALLAPVGILGVINYYKANNVDMQV